MPTTKKRVNISLAPESERLLARIAKRDNVPAATKAGTAKPKVLSKPRKTRSTSHTPMHGSRVRRCISEGGRNRGHPEVAKDHSGTYQESDRNKAHNPTGFVWQTITPFA
mgnify:CR=1 FL=1